MSSFIKAMQEIMYIAQKADVHSAPRVSITFDTLHDRERFKLELERDISQMVQLKHQFNLGFSEMTCAGVKVRIL